MSTGLLLILLILALAALALVILVAGRALRNFLRFRGTRVITCPETQQPAAVEVDAPHAAATATSGRPHLRLRECSRWPERRDCGQECLSQVEAAPEGCLIRSILAHWYEGKSCALCGKAFGEIHWHDHKPALLSPERELVVWRQLKPETVPAALETHRPICWDCHVLEAFRRMHPDLVVDRDSQWFSNSTEEEEEKKEQWPVN
jgi:hypothetical protein